MNRVLTKKDHWPEESTRARIWRALDADRLVPRKAAHLVDMLPGTSIKAVQECLLRMCASGYIARSGKPCKGYVIPPGAPVPPLMDVGLSDDWGRDVGLALAELQDCPAGMDEDVLAQVLELSIHGVAQLLQGLVDEACILKDWAPRGTGMVKRYRLVKMPEAVAGEPERALAKLPVAELDIDAMHQREDVTPPIEGGFECALFDDGRLYVRSHGRQINLPLAHTRKLLHYLDRLALEADESEGLLAARGLLSEPATGSPA